MSGITVKVVETAGEMLTGLVKMYQDKLDKAYLKSDGALTVDFKAKFKPAGNGDMEVDVSINFVTDRIKNNFSRTVCEGQDDLFANDKSEEVRPDQPEQLALTEGIKALPEGEVVDAEFSDIKQS